MSATPLLALPPFVLTDSYKLAHFAMYPPETDEMVAYGEFRHAFNKCPTDHRVVFYGMRYLIETYINKQWTAADLALTERFLATHNAGFTPYPFPIELFRDMIAHNDGYFPVTIEALPEGSVVYPHVPVYQITASGKWARLVTYLETLLTMVWYPTSVATLSRRSKHAIAQSFVRTVDGCDPHTGAHPLLNSRLHDFGFRGCTSVEQAVIGGSAHLLNFEGSDTVAACYYAQFHCNHGAPVASSIPATEHSVMTSWPSERAALANALDKFGAGVVACVMDSYDYVLALEKVLPAVKAVKLAKGGFLVLRPDSGDPVETVVQALRAADKVFGSQVNAKGFKVPNGCGVIQGDGINDETLVAILKAVEKEGYSSQAVAFGMGGGLLQKVNRDTMSFATKLSYLRMQDGVERDVMKVPKTDSGKTSLPGKLAVVYENELPMVYPLNHPTVAKLGGSKLQVVYDGTNPATRGKPFHWDSFTQVRERVEAEWYKLPAIHDPVPEPLKAKQKEIIRTFRVPSADE
ncbi:nicotinate phosphoribosyltransferase family-domain-containing protein [Catenaria anguillulae PL171]|uniref:Nicotinamide phosphoribosyltransferase n=1 Tax=Catenaria anguillulae PL171 TaxID=765915 RepID=A0A1Y2HMK4_9FUNG|nr:nicotinate phosphoribosyltransferase family-domain-containing protein [Catenaria anguillulae PL171]